jgi:hypothetical protein
MTDPQFRRGVTDDHRICGEASPMILLPIHLRRLDVLLTIICDASANWQVG